jgi:hypothetical protein
VSVPVWRGMMQRSGRCGQDAVGLGVRNHAARLSGMWGCMANIPRAKKLFEQKKANYVLESIATLVCCQRRTPRAGTTPGTAAVGPHPRPGGAVDGSERLTSRTGGRLVRTQRTQTGDRLVRRRTRISEARSEANTGKRDAKAGSADTCEWRSAIHITFGLHSL